MAPYDVMARPGTLGYALVFGLIGFGFGAVLEMAGFGDTRKLAAQFYLKEMTVLKVMFTAIAVAAVLIFGASALGLLDFSRVYVDETWLWPGIAGGAVMGVGFVIGGFCPGTSIVAASTLKVDGIFFLVGTGVGTWLFGETVGAFQPFFLSSEMGRYMLPELFGLPVGATVLVVVGGALLMFWGGELAERFFGQKVPWAQIAKWPVSRVKLAGAAALLVACLFLIVRGQPTPTQQWNRLPAEAKGLVASRDVFVHPAEVVELRKDVNVKVAILDVRDEHQFNLFHVGGAERLDASRLAEPAVHRPLLDQPPSTVTFLIGTGEEGALRAWKELKALGVGNLYVVEGGINRWLELYALPQCVAQRATVLGGDSDALGYRFEYAVGDQAPASWPDLPTSHGFRIPCGVGDRIGEQVTRGEAAHHGVTWPAYAFTHRVKLQVKSAVKGGCG
jgi:rhodanese-related sulfurtransferase